MIMTADDNLWTVEFEPESGTYLLLDPAGCYAAELHWNEHGECWAQFEPYTAFSGPTTIAHVEALQQLAALLRAQKPPPTHTPKNPR